MLTLLFFASQFADKTRLANQRPQAPGQRKRSLANTVEKEEKGESVLSTVGTNVDTR